MKYIFILLTLFYANVCTAQFMINTRLDKTSAYIGDPIHLTVLAVGPADTHILLPSIDSIPNFEIINVSKLDSSITTNNKRIEQEYIIVGFDTGVHLIPSYEFKVNHQKMYTDPIELNIQFLPADVSGEFKDIHHIEAVPPPPSKFWWWFSAGIIIIGLIIYILNQIKKKPIKNKITNTSSFEEILQQLQNLRKINEPNSTDYQVLVNVLRGYLVQTQSFPATGQTYFHLFRFVQNLKLKLDQVNDLKSTLNAASVTVFALRKQTNEQWQKDINHVSNIILQLNANKN